MYPYLQHKPENTVFQRMRQPVVAASQREGRFQVMGNDDGRHYVKLTRVSVA